MKELLHFIMILAVASCKKDSVEINQPSPAPIVIKASGGQDTMMAAQPAPIAERRYNPNAGGTGNGNGGGQNSGTTEWQVIEVNGTWNVTYDTSVCGFLIMKWDDQNRPADTDSLKVSDYGLEVVPRPSYCAGEAVCLTNLFWTKYGMTCAIRSEQEYDIRFGWAKYDNTNKVCTKYFSEWVHVYTGVAIEKCK